MEILRSRWPRLSAAGVLVIVGTLTEAKAAGIGGVTTANPVSANPLNPHPINRDDRDVLTPLPITFLSSSAIITTAAAPFQGYNFIFAGSAGVGMNFTPIDPSDFNIEVYQPWVVNSLPVKSPGGTTYNRNVTGNDAGGENIIIDYNPDIAEGDPTSVNFLQAYSATLNSMAPIVDMDNGTAGAVPYYNATGASGTDNSDVHQVPLNAASAKAWMLDTPFLCESGFTGTGTGCPVTTPQNDETYTSYVDTFNMFIEADQTVAGTPYNVLYGGLQWGFTLTMTDVPEPSTWTMMLAGFAGLAFSAHSRAAAAPRPLAAKGPAEGDG